MFLLKATVANHRTWTCPDTRRLNKEPFNGQIIDSITYAPGYHSLHMQICSNRRWVRILTGHPLTDIISVGPATTFEVVH